MTARGVGTETPDFHDAWVAALVVLELDVDRAEDLLRSHTAEVPDLIPWTPPTGIGMLPLTLVDRVRVLHQRQLEVAVVLAAAIAGNRRQSALAEAIDSTRPEARPVFVDRAC